ncbi:MULTISPECIES: glutaconate CoA-transferase subunit A [Acidaminococcus]|uniref:glutaconate CoA-transferase subunit A n=1 Tax=Acidaminococcus TaxID=904 RepID=UPI002597A5BE|nr:MULTISPECIES: glutaconate CoA-transferase subunit A [Acidaminococcus]MDD6569076.1 glutaconate CoA-transferase subunit A [Acidaminococcus sp.]MDO5597583.1 glutaconate CoA-transferase subunit A [Acidaminococcus sp.]
MSKVMTLKDAIAKYVHSGDHIALGGFTTDRKPYAAVYEILRQGITDLTGLGGAAGGDWDMLIGNGRVKAYINCYTANSGVTNVSRRFRKWFEAGKLTMEDYSQDVIYMMWHAAALGLPFLPVTLMQGSGLTDEWGISKEVRKTLDKVPDDKFKYIDNPFKPGEKVVAVPVPQIDVAIIHAQQASPDGTVRIWGGKFQDVDIAEAAKYTIVTCEEIISNEEIRRDPTKNDIPGMCVDAVVLAPYGAHPSQCYGLYDYDNPFLKVYDVVSKTQEDFDAFCKEWVFDLKDHDEYLNKLGATRLINLKVVPGLGYHIDMTKEDK